MTRERAPVVGLTLAGRRNVIGPMTKKILDHGAKMKKLDNNGLFGAEYKTKAKDILSSRFMVPPFSVLNTREGEWQQRKAQWVSIGIKSELGRGYFLTAASYNTGKPGDLRQQFKDSSPGGSPRPLTRMKQQRLVHSAPGGSLLPAASGRKYGDPIVRGDGHGRAIVKGTTWHQGLEDVDRYRNKEAGSLAKNQLVRADGKSVYLHPHGENEDEVIGGTSIFDPVLAELSYRWFAPPGGRVLDPFAGGSVRGIVAGELGLQYVGIDLSERQIAANEKQAEEIGTDPCPIWVVGDSHDVLQELAEDEVRYNMMLSCPPYGHLERYSDDPRDISTLPVDEFRDKYTEIIERACALLENNSFAVFVVGDYRDKEGMYCGLPNVTIDAFEAAGLRLYNHAILLTAIGSLPLRINAQFVGSRKLGTTHQHVLVFARGQPREFVKSWESTFLNNGSGITSATPILKEEA